MPTPSLVKIPTAPQGADAKHDAARETETIKGLRDVSDLLLALLENLEPFRPVMMQDANGQNLQVLAKRFDDTPINQQFFELVDATERDGTGAVTARKIQVVASTINGDLPDGMTMLDDPAFTLTVSGDGEVYAQVTFDPTTGDITYPVINKGVTTPASTDTTKTRVLGGFSVPSSDQSPIGVNNVTFGPLTATACRDWFSFPVKYGFSWGE